MSLENALQHATSLLPGTPSPEGQSDPRWKAIIRIADYYIETDPEPIWEFVRRWGACPLEDVRDAIACCLLEHLLEHHFERIFPRVEIAVREDPLFADTFSRCWQFGQAEAATASERWLRLQAWIADQHYADA